MKMLIFKEKKAYFVAEFTKQSITILGKSNAKTIIRVSPLGKQIPFFLLFTKNEM